MYNISLGPFNVNTLEIKKVKSAKWTFPLPADDSPAHVHSSEVFIEFVLYYLCSSFHFVFLMCTFFLIGITWLFKMESNRRVCVNHPDKFCNICGQYTPKQQCRNITKSIQFAYKYYFDCKLGDQDKELAPHVCCALYNSMLSAWINGKRKAMPHLVSEESTSDTETGEGDMYVPDADNSPHLFGPAELLDLVRYLE